jgi:hypothetical protein
VIYAFFCATKRAMKWVRHGAFFPWGKFHGARAIARHDRAMDFFHGALSWRTA